MIRIIDRESNFWKSIRGSYRKTSHILAKSAMIAENAGCTSVER